MQPTTAEKKWKPGGASGGAQPMGCNQRRREKSGNQAEFIKQVTHGVQPNTEAKGETQGVQAQGCNPCGATTEAKGENQGVQPMGCNQPRRQKFKNSMKLKKNARTNYLTCWRTTKVRVLRWLDRSCIFSTNPKMIDPDTGKHFPDGRRGHLQKIFPKDQARTGIRHPLHLRS